MEALARLRSSGMASASGLHPQTPWVTHKPRLQAPGSRGSWQAHTAHLTWIASRMLAKHAKGSGAGPHSLAAVPAKTQASSAKTGAGKKGGGGTGKAGRGSGGSSRPAERRRSGSPAAPPPRSGSRSRRAGAAAGPAVASSGAGISMPGETPMVATLAVLAGVAVLLAGGAVFHDQIKAFLDYFIAMVDELGDLGMLAYAAVYTALEVLAVPAIPLTMTAGAIFGPVKGTAIVSASATVAATAAFLIARYAARTRVKAWVDKTPRFAAIDRAIGKDGLKFVVLLRLSPLLPLAVSNYIYGLTSVDLGAYVLGSWLGMLPGTLAYVTAGHVGQAVLHEGGEGMGGLGPWQLAAGLGVTALALGFVGQLAKNAIEEADAEKYGKR